MTNEEDNEMAETIYPGLHEYMAKSPPSHETLGEMSDEEIVEHRDRLAQDQLDGTWQFWDDVLNRRSTDKLNRTMEGWTRTMGILAMASFIASFLALIVSVASLVVTLKAR